MKDSLDRSAWVSAGLAALADKGLDAVRVERLAADLKVTKGSFYWHFRDRADLLAMMVEAWRTSATTDIITRVEARATDPADRLKALFATVLRADGRLEMAMRDWAARDAGVGAVVAETDARRVAYVEALFAAVGVPGRRPVPAPASPIRRCSAISAWERARRTSAPVKSAPEKRWRSSCR